MTATVDRIRGLRRYRLVIAQKAKLRLSPEVATALASRTANHRPFLRKKIIAIPGIIISHIIWTPFSSMLLSCNYTPGLTTP